MDETYARAVVAAVDHALESLPAGNLENIVEGDSLPAIMIHLAPLPAADESAQ